MITIINYNIFLPRIDRCFIFRVNASQVDKKCQDAVELSRTLNIDGYSTGVYNSLNALLHAINKTNSPANRY